MQDHPYTKEVFLQYLERAAFLFSSGEDSPIDFVKLSLHFQPIPVKLSDYLVEFFHCIRRHLELTISKQNAYTEALHILASRFVDSCQLHLVRDNVKTPLNELPTVMDTVLEEVRSLHPL